MLIENTKYRIIVLLLLGFPYSIFAQQRWTLNECIAYALEHNIEIKSQELEAESKRVGLAESKWAYANNTNL